MTESSVADAYDGPATLVSSSSTVEVEVALRGVFQPIDGHYHWYGRVAADDAVDTLVESRADVSLRTPHGEVVARLSDRDPWGRYRVGGTGRPPFPPAD
jgi:hypothetical protein